MAENEKRERGRPPLPEDEKRGSYRFRVSPSELEKWQRAANAKGVKSLSEWIRSTVTRAAKRIVNKLERDKGKNDL